MGAHTVIHSTNMWVPTLPGPTPGAEVKSNEQNKFPLLGILYPNEGETIIWMNRYIIKFQAVSHV